MDGKYQSNVYHGIMFHHFHDENEMPSGQGSLTAFQFEEILHYIGTHRILSPDEWIYKLRLNRLENTDVCITFDDGLKCQYDIALPILEAYKIKAFWYIYSSVFNGEIEKLEIFRRFRTKYFSCIDDFYRLFFDKYISCGFPKINVYEFQEKIREIKKLYPFYSNDDILFRITRDKIIDNDEYDKLIDEIIHDHGIKISDLANNLWMKNQNLITLCEKGHTIGLHAYNHPTELSKYSYGEQKNQYKRNYEHIEETCKIKPISVSYPNNSYNSDTFEILKELNILFGFRSNMKVTGSRIINEDSFIIPRMDHSNILRKIKPISNTEDKY